VSTDAIMVVTGTIPIHLLAVERAEIEAALKTGATPENAKQEARVRTMGKWQLEWNGARNGRWTHWLIPNIQAWIDRKWGSIKYHLTQFLTGHGCFNAYLLKYKKREDAVCMYCGYAQDDVEHTFIVCDRWWRQRRELEVKLGRAITPERMLEGMLEKRKKWNAVVNFINAVLSRKEADEWTIQAAARNALI